MFRFKNTETGEEFSINTRKFIKTVMKPVEVSYDLYDMHNNIKSVEELAKMGLELVEYKDKTQEDIDREYVQKLYSVEVEGAYLKSRVINYVELLTSIGITDYSFINTELIEDALNKTFPGTGSEIAEKKADKSLRLSQAFNDITVNLGAVCKILYPDMDGEHIGTAYDTWELIPKLIKYMTITDSAE